MMLAQQPFTSNGKYDMGHSRRRNVMFHRVKPTHLSATFTIIITVKTRGSELQCCTV